MFETIKLSTSGRSRVDDLRVEWLEWLGTKFKVSERVL
jgi:hypothetical protein